MTALLMRAAVLLMALALASPALAKWREASSRHFVIYSEDSADDLRRFADRLERYDAAIRYLQKLPPHDPGPANRLTVFVVGTPSDVRRLMHNPQVNATGFYIPRAGGSVAVVPRRGLGDGRFGLQAETILLHEYAHHFMLENFPAGYPAWFIEGFAEFNPSAKFNEDGSVGIGMPAMHRAYGLALGSPLSAETLLTADARELNADQRQSLYARGWLLTHFLTFNEACSGDDRSPSRLDTNSL